MRLSDLVSVDEAWYDPRTWGKGKPAAAPAAPKDPAIGSNWTSSNYGSQTAPVAAATKPAKRTGGGAKPSANQSMQNLYPEDERAADMGRLFGPGTNAPAAPAPAAKPADKTAALSTSQVSAAKPAAAPAADPTKDPYSAVTDTSLQAGYKEIAAAPPPPDVEAMKTGIAAGSPAAQAAAPTQTAVAKPEATPAEPAKSTATAAPVIPGINASATTPTPPAAAQVKTQTPAGQIMAEEITMKKLLQIFEAETFSQNVEKNKAAAQTPAAVKPSPVEKLPLADLSNKPQIAKLPVTPVDPTQFKKTDPAPAKPTDAPAAKPAGPSNFAKEFAKQRALQGSGGSFEFGGKKYTTDLKGEKGSAAKPASTTSTSSNEPTSYPDTATNNGKAYSDNVPLSKSASMAQSQNDPLMNPQPDAKPTQVGSDNTSGAKPSEKVPDNVGPIVRTGTGDVLTTSDGTPVRSRSADEIEWQMKNPMQTYPGADAVAKQKEQGEKNWKSFKDFIGFGDKPEASAAPAPTPTSGGDAKPSAKTPEVMIENELSEILRLSGLQLNEKAVSKQQQKFMGMVHSMQKGEKVKGASSELKKAAKDMSKKDAKDFAATKHKGLPQKVTEGIMLEAGNTLEHIINKFKHETKNFLAGSELDKDLFEALFDYYNDNGEMPYGVAKARDGDPYQWIEQRLENELDMIGYQRMNNKPDNSLSELARLAGLHESKIDECGDMSMNQSDTFNVSTNLSSDGTKSINISAQGDKADALMQMLKMAGMRPHDDHDHMSHEEPEIVLVSGDDEMMEEPELEEERITQYSNTPEEEYETIAAITRQGNDLNREKQQWNPDRGRDNPMAIELEESLAAMLESIKVTEGGAGGIDAEQPYKDPKTGKMITPPKGATMPPPDNEFPAGDKRNMMPPKQKGAK